MGTLQQIREGVSRAWEGLQEGWQQLRERASDALTRFSPSAGKGGERQLELTAPRWGLLAAEVREDENQIEVRIEVPGMERSDFDIEVINDVLVVRGEKHIEREEHKGHFHIMERAYGRFERAIPLGATVDETAAKARYRRGVLSISLPKRNAGKSRRIKVKGD